MTVSTRAIHDGASLAISSRHPAPATPGLDMALATFQMLMDRSQGPGKEQHFHTLPLAKGQITNRQDGQDQDGEEGEPMPEAVGHVELGERRSVEEFHHGVHGPEDKECQRQGHVQLLGKEVTG